MPLGIAARDFKRRRRKIHRSRVQVRPGVRQRHSDGSRTGAHINDARVRFRSNVLQCCFDQMLGFGARDEDSRGDFEEQAEKLLRTSDVLHGLAGQASRRGLREVAARRARAARKASPALAATLCHSGCFSLETLSLVVRDQGVDGWLEPAFHDFRELVIG